MLIDSVATHPNAIIRYRARNTVLHVDSETAYLKLGEVGSFIFSEPIIDGETCTVTWVLSNIFMEFTNTPVGWLIILPPGAVWDIMGYESYPLPPLPELRNCSYSVK